MTLKYFAHPNYDHYPVVGIKRHQAKAFVIGEHTYAIVISINDYAL